MGKIPNELRETIARNIRECRMKKYPGRGGGKKCAESFGVSAQQWSPWERGMRTPDELRLLQIADFFGVTVEFLRRDNRINQSAQNYRQESPSINPDGGSFGFAPPHVAYPSGSPGTTHYVPVFVLLPHLPENMKAIYEHFNSMLNSGRKDNKPSA